jgi:hypothetical protein
MKAETIYSMIADFTEVFGKFGDEGDRTPDLLNAIQTLSQLSYAPDMRLNPGKFMKKSSSFLSNSFDIYKQDLPAFSEKNQMVKFWI